MTEVPDWASIERQAEAVAFSDMMEAADLDAQEVADAIEQVRGACEAIKSAELTPIGVKEILMTLSRTMLESSRFTEIDAAYIEDMASDF
jgi:hypothetical protein